MRISVQYVSSGGRSLTRFPTIEKSLEDLRLPNGHIDVAAARQMLEELPSKSFSSNDNETTFVLAIEFLTRVHRWTSQSIANEDNDCHNEAQDRYDRQNVRKMDGLKFVWIKMNITPRAVEVYDDQKKYAAARVEIAIDNPHGVKGETVMKARDFAFMAVKIWLRIAYGCRESAKVYFYEGANCEGLFKLAAADEEWLDARAEAQKKLDELLKKRSICPSLHGGYCSPVCPTCELCEGGKCKEPSLPSEYADDKRPWNRL